MIIADGKIVAPTAANTGVDPLALRSTVADLLGFKSQAQELEAAAAGSLLTAAGADAEAAAYGTAAGIAGENQRVEAIAENVRQIQIMRNVDQTVGGIKASVAANGFQQSGSAIDIMRSSLQQGYLSTQISGLASSQTQRGYMEQAAAASGEMAAAGTRGDAARLLATMQASAGKSATANQAALTDALGKLLSGDPNAQGLVDALMAGDLAGVQAGALLYNPNGDGPLATADTGAGTIDTLVRGGQWWENGIAPWNEKTMADRKGIAPGTQIMPFGPGGSGPLIRAEEGWNVNVRPFSR